MDEKIVNNIIEAEQRAESIIAEANERAKVIIASAEERAVKIREENNDALKAMQKKRAIDAAAKAEKAAQERIYEGKRQAFGGGDTASVIKIILSAIEAEAAK